MISQTYNLIDNDQIVVLRPTDKNYNLTKKHWILVKVPDTNMVRYIQIRCNNMSKRNAEELEEKVKALYLRKLELEKSKQEKEKFAKERNYVECQNLLEKYENYCYQTNGKVLHEEYKNQFNLKSEIIQLMIRKNNS